MKTEIRKLLGTDKLIIGTERTIKALKKDELAKIIVSKNCSESVRAQLKGKAEIVEADENNEELGVLCKKPFRIALLGIKK